MRSECQASVLSSLAWCSIILSMLYGQMHSRGKNWILPGEKTQYDIDHKCASENPKDKARAERPCVALPYCEYSEWIGG